MISIASTSKLPVITTYSIKRLTSLNQQYRSFNTTRINKTKIQTVLFECNQETAIERLETAAASAFGLSAVVKLLLHRFIGTETPLTLMAIKPLLLPYFKVDLSLRGKITVGEEDSVLNISVSALDATVPAFKMSPLDQLNLDSLQGDATIPFDSKVHLNQHSQSISLIPFSTSPIGLLKKLASLPRTVNDNFSFNPSNFKPNMFAMYPLYLPVYLAEFADRSEEPRRVTCLAFANHSSPGFAVYPSFLKEPRWLPNGGGIEVSIAGVAQDRTPGAPNSMGALAKLKPQLDNLLGEGKAAEFCDPLPSIEELESNPRVLPYSEHGVKNKAFVSASLAVMAAESNLKFAEAMPDQAKTVVLSTSGLKVQDVKEMKDALKISVDKLKEVAKLAKPEWLEELEKVKK